MTVISIIGGGATGTATLIALLNEIKKIHHPAKLTINLFEPKLEVGIGLAYQPSLTNVLLNTSVDCTYIVADEHQHFEAWLAQNESRWRSLFPEVNAYDAESFLPRALCGLYIKDTLENELATVSDLMVKVNIIHANVIDIKLAHYASQSWMIHTASASYPSDVCVLATGYGQGKALTYPYLAENKHYYASPYLCVEEIKNIPKDAKVLIIGTGLSAIDAALILKNHDNVTLTSRKGFIPAVRNRVIRFMPMHLTEVFQKQFFMDNFNHLTLDKLKKEIETELSLRLKQNIRFNKLARKSNVVNQLKKDIHLARNKANAWEDSIWCILKFIDSAWNFLTPEDKKALVDTEMVHISRYISSFPLQNAEIILQKLKSKTLQIKTSISTIYIDGDKFKAEFNENHSLQHEQYDYVVNATPVDKHAMTLSGLYLNLLDRGIIQHNEFGGIKVNNQCQVIGKINKNPPLFAAGPITKGSFLITNLLATSAKQGAIIAKSILSAV